MLSKQLHEITETDLQRLVDERWEEDSRLDFKQTLPGDDDRGRKEFCKDVCALANTSGGDLVFGIAEQEGIAASLVPQALPGSVDSYIRKLESMLRDRVEPVVQGVSIHAVPVSGGHVVVVRVPRSFTGMHRVKSEGHFYVRKSRSNEQLDVPGIINRVSDYLGREDRVKAFFARRYADILTNEHPIPLSAGAKLVVHLVPARDYLDGAEIQLDTVVKGGRTIPLLDGPSGSRLRNTYEGPAYFSDNGAGVATCFTLFMRHGVIEAVSDLTPLYGSTQVPKLNLTLVEGRVFQFLQAFISSGLLEATTEWPLSLRVALLATNGVDFESGRSDDYNLRATGLPVRQPLPVLVLPDAFLEEPDSNLEDALAPTFLRMWHAWGYRTRVTRSS